MMSQRRSSEPAALASTLAALGKRDPDAEQKYRDLLRMRRLATLLLVFMTCVFVASSYGLRLWSGLAYVRAFSEAATVGACADWFAVVALFRRPFGLPIPHTGIVPRNKERIGGALGRFMSNNFLSPAVLAKRLDRIEAAAFAINWLNQPDNAKRLARQASDFLPQALGALPRDALVVWLSDAAIRGLAAVPAAALASKGLSLLWAQGETQALLDSGIAWAETALLSNKDYIRTQVTQNSSRLIPKWVDSLLADRVISGLQSSLADMRKPDHPWRQEVKRAVEELIFDLAHDAQMRERAEALKHEWLANPVVVAQIREACDGLHAQTAEALAERTSTLSSALEFALLAFARWLRGDPRNQRRLDRWIRRAALRALSPRRAEIGHYIAGVVANWDASTLVNRLELQVGRDLQYIRINGTLVGGLVGLVIFVASQFLPTL